MTITASSIVASLESDLVQFLTQKTLDGLIKNVSTAFAGGLVGGVAGWIIGLVVATGVQYGDWLTYMLVESWKTSNEATAYENAVTTRQNLPPGASDADIKNAEQAQMDAFNQLVNLGST